jgi:hypothetical protein
MCIGTFIDFIKNPQDFNTQSFDPVKFKKFVVKRCTTELHLYMKDVTQQDLMMAEEFASQIAEIIIHRYQSDF